MKISSHAAPGLLVLLCSPGLSAAPAPPQGAGQVTNLGLAGSDPAVDAGCAAFAVKESQQGGADLNGDGDAEDLVLHLHDAVSDSTTNLGLAIAGLSYLHKGFLAFFVDEAAQGGTDLNGDGDALDLVAHVHHIGTGTTSNLGLARGWTATIGEGAFVFEVREADQGATDLNGDGDTDDHVLHVYDLAGAVLTNTGLAGSLILKVEPSDGLVLAKIQEAAQGKILNGDGDFGDTVLFALELPGGAATNTGLASWNGVIFPGRIAVSVNEMGQAAQDLNNDGDTGDDVLHVYDIASSTASNMSLAAWGSSMTRFGTHLAFLIDEAGHGGSDLNGDQDTLDQVMAVHHVPSGTTVNLALGTKELENGFWADGERLAFPVSESQQAGTDLNADLDATDVVVHTYDPIRGLVVNLGLASDWGVLRGKRLTISVREADQGGLDLNGDGDALDEVLYEHDLLNWVTNNLGLAGKTYWNGDETLVEAFEYKQGVDLNGDGDTNDNVPHAHEAFAGAPISIGMAGTPVGFDEGMQVFAASEPGNGMTDLNGDGDAADMVLFTFEPLYPFGLETDADAFSVSAGGTLAFELDAGHAHRDDFYLILGSFLGTDPGLFLGGFPIPLNYDTYFDLTVKGANSPPFTGTLGLLDSVGEGQAAFTLPSGSPTALVGIRANHAYVVLDSLTGYLTFVSNAVPLRFVP